MDRLRLIAEVYKRPALWDSNYRKGKKLRWSLPDIWQEVAGSMGPDVSVDDCKMKWQNLRCTYWKEVRRIAKDMDQDKEEGVYDPKDAYKSKWVCFEQMDFLRQIANSHDSYKDDEESEICSEKYIVNNIKEEADIEAISDIHSLNEENVNKIENHSAKRFKPEILQQTQTRDFSQTHSLTKFNFSARCSSQGQDDTDDNATNYSYDHMNYSEDLKNDKNNLTISKISDIKRSNDLFYARDSDYNFLVSCMAQMKIMDKLQNLQFRAEMTDLLLYILSPSISKYPKNGYDQMHYSEDLKKKEQHLIESGVLNTKRFNNAVYVGDSDYHFLVSCLSQMKVMNTLQNLQFRAKITKMLLSILSPSLSKNDATLLSS